MPNTKLVPSGYRKLVSDIVRLFEGVHRSLVEAGWKTGQWIVEVEQEGDARATRGDQLLSKLSEDLTKRLGSGFSVPSLRRMRRFYLDNPKRSPASVITWAHHIELLPIRDKKIRLALERRAERDELDRDSLRALVRHERVREQVAENLKTPSENREPPDLLPVPKKGPLNTYRIIDASETAWPDKKVLLLDHGFKGYRALVPADHRGLKAGDIVEWTGAKLLKTGRTAKDLYTYKAYLESVIDGDTLWVVLDIGASEISRQKLRLRGIDCPEINTREGQAAKKFVEAVLKDVTSLTVISSKNPTYDRYEADVFIPAQSSKLWPEVLAPTRREYIPARNLKVSAGGTGAAGLECYLNNLLLQEGYAVRVRS